MPQFLVFPDDVDAEAGEARLRGEEARHLLAVLRARPGDLVLVFDGLGNRWSGRLREVRGPEQEAWLGDLTPLPPNEPSVEITLVQSVPKGDRWEWILEKATELGVVRIAPVYSSRSVTAVSHSRRGPKSARWRGIAAAAAKQCERARIPVVEPPVELSAFLSGLRKPSHGEARVVLAERFTGEAALPSEPLETALLAVGPEGGWAPHEMEAFRLADFIPLGFGPRILRSETAALAGIVTILLRWGALAGAKIP
jgi:16S rRNA (uracil1498-N3)-methyltransferase